jgi:hypothetical protein
MAKEEKEKKDGKREESREKKPKKHLHRISHEIIRDHEGKPTGETIEHHIYKTHPTDHQTEPERPMAVHSTPEEAGESTTENLQQAMAQGEEPEPEAQPAAAAAGGEA